MVRLDDIIEAYMSARRNKRRSADQVDFELHWESRCIDLYERIQNHTLQPSAYTFVVDYPRPREVFASDMGTRVLHHYIDRRMRPLLEARLSSHTFNNRIGMGQNACQNAVISDIYEMSKGFTQDAWTIKLDMSGCFPNIVQDIAYKQLEEVILKDYKGEDKDELLYILRVCVFSYPTQHCYRKSPYCKWSKVADAKSLNKFYCQHYTKGVECLGVHIKMDRVYTNRRIVNRGKQKAKRMNRNIRASDVLKLLPSINSYLGFCKNTNGYNQAKSIIRKLSPKWGEFVRFNKHRVCIEALSDYTERNQIIKRYNLLRNGTNRKRRA